MCHAGSIHIRNCWEYAFDLSSLCEACCEPVDLLGGGWNEERELALDVLVRVCGCCSDAAPALVQGNRCCSAIAVSSGGCCGQLSICTLLLRPCERRPARRRGCSFLEGQRRWRTRIRTQIPAVCVEYCRSGTAAACSRILVLTARVNSAR